MNTPQQQNRPDTISQANMAAPPRHSIQGQPNPVPPETRRANRPMPPHQEGAAPHPSPSRTPFPGTSASRATGNHAGAFPPSQSRPGQTRPAATQQYNRPMPPQQGGRPAQSPYSGQPPLQQPGLRPQGNGSAPCRQPVVRQAPPRQQNRPAYHPSQTPDNGLDDYIGMNQAAKSAAPGFMEKEFMPTLLDAYSIAVKNALSIVLAILLWILTLWIPYINIGTTIALCTMPLALSRNKPISPTFIFDKRYRQFFGEFFLTGGLMLAGILAGALFCGFPAIVILISWSLAPMLVLDKGCNASEALTLSNKYTYGNKFLIFILFLAFLVSLGVLLGILGFILGAIADALGFIAILLAIILIPATGVGLIAAIYKRLVYQNSSPS